MQALTIVEAAVFFSLGRSWRRQCFSGRLRGYTQRLAVSACDQRSVENEAAILRGGRNKDRHKGGG